MRKRPPYPALDIWRRWWLVKIEKRHRARICRAPATRIWHLSPSSFLVADLATSRSNFGVPATGGVPGHQRKGKWAASCVLHVVGCCGGSLSRRTRAASKFNWDRWRRPHSERERCTRSWLCMRNYTTAYAETEPFVGTRMASCLSSQFCLHAQESKGN